ncbi:hypothetical protein TRFO_27520 [Tritrichomonas foetus]|uniref:Uncharacterized protein n=1 Tax=Tritrichomonas foetus TaxID=1144522 RepID=A0A1J4K5F7_9EUKA|nr:hypothetical protein TRFO_27520 [Tritrichomonas foetus]|eukprot:OHT04902.1 hypothetical protein TRFO_27520 [Tritrichomonas foetus]
MSLFLPPNGIPNNSDTIETANKIASSLQYYYNLNSPKLLSNSVIKLKESIFQSICLARATFLLNMTLMDDFSFFESPSLNEMLKGITETPEALLKHINTTLSQAVTVFIARIHCDIITFSNFVEAYFEEDPTLHLVFSNSTFPAIFGFFTLDFFCKLGAELIIAIIPNEKLNVLIKSMIVSFFFSIHYFFEFFIHLLYKGFSTEMSHEDIFNLFSSTLKSSLDFLTMHHITVLRAFNSIYPEQCSSFFIHDILINAIQFRNRWCDERFHSFDSFEFLDFIENLTKSETDQLMEIVFNHDNFCNILPQFPDSSLLPKIPIILSDRDIYTLIQIVGDKETLATMTIDPQALINASSKFYEGNYSPFCAEIMNSYSENKTKKSSCKNNEIPNNNQQSNPQSNNQTNLKTTQNLAFNFHIRMLKNKAYQAGLPNFLSFFPKTSFYSFYAKLPSSISITDDFTVYALNFYIKEATTELQIAEKATNCFILQNQIDFWKEHIYKTYNALLYLYSHQTVMKNIAIAKKKSFKKNIYPKHLKSIMKRMKKFDSSISYQSMISFLDFAQIEHNDLFLKYVFIFINGLNKIKFSQQYHNLLNYCKEMSSQMKRSFSMGFGSRIWLLLNIVQQLKVANIEIQFLHYTIFNNICFYANGEDLYNTLIVFKHFVYSNKKLRKMLTDETNLMIDILFSYFFKLVANIPVIQNLLVE